MFFGLPMPLMVAGKSIELVGYVTANGSGTSVSCNGPSEMMNGDLLVAVALSQAGIPNAITGGAFSTDYVSPAGGPGIRISSKIADFEPGSYSYSVSSGNKSLTMLAFRKAASILVGVPYKGSATPSNPAPAIDAIGGLLLGVFHNQASGSTIVTPPSGMDQLFLQNAAAPTVAIYSAKAPVGDTGVKTLDWNAAAAATAAMLIEVR